MTLSAVVDDPTLSQIAKENGETINMSNRISSCIISSIVAVFMQLSIGGNLAYADNYLHAFWNSFLSMSNIIELHNSTNQTAIFYLTVHNSAGAKIGGTKITLPSREQRNIALNSIASIQPNQNGMVSLLSPEGATARVLTYTTDTSRLGAVEEMRDSIIGESYVLSNSYSPDTAPTRTDNWLAVANTSSTRTANFLVQQYLSDGSVFRRMSIKLKPLERADLLLNIDTSYLKAGLVIIKPQSVDTQYIATLSRNGFPNSPSTLGFLQIQPSRYASSSSSWLQISNGGDVEPWLELANASDSRISANLKFFSSAYGELPSLTRSLQLKPFNTLHLNLSSILRPGESGALQLSTSGSGKIVAQAVSYARDERGVTKALYSNSNVIAEYTRLTGSYNSFLNTNNWLRLFNTSTKSAEVVLTIQVRQNISTKRIVLPAKRGTDFFLNSQVPSNSYGALSVTAKHVLAQVLRTNMDSLLSSTTLSPLDPTELIYKPQPLATWQIQYSGQLDTSVPVQMYDIDLFDSSEASFNVLRKKNRKIICYFSAGSWEDWRTDKDQYPTSILGLPLEGWPGERWIDIRRIDKLEPIILDRLRLAVQRNCDGVDPDNVNAYANQSGFSLTAANQLRFNLWLAKQAHLLGLSIGLKNDVDQIPDLVKHYDWALNEECFQMNECDKYQLFTNLNKAVFGIEYTGETSDFCPTANSNKLSWLLKNLKLDAWGEACLP